MKQISTIHTYNGAINCLAWFNSVIASGNKSGYVSIWDKRMNEASIIYNGHYQ
jgi:WD40 repeat protein